MDLIKTIYRNFQDAMDFIGRRQIASIAAATGFWFFLSLVPIVIFFTAILPYTSMTQEQILQFVAQIAPPSFYALISTILADVYTSHLGVLSLSLVTTLWSSAQGFSSLIRGLEEINDVDIRKRAGYFMRRLRGILYTLAMLMLIISSIILVGFGRSLARLLKSRLPAAGPLLSFLVRFRFLMVIAVLMIFFIAIFRWSTGKRPPFARLWPGALLAAAGWCLFSSLFSLWVSYNGFTTYGSLATVVVVMLWLYYCQYILLIGAIFNRALPILPEKVRRGRDALRKKRLPKEDSSLSENNK